MLFSYLWGQRMRRAFSALTHGLRILAFANQLQAKREVTNTLLDYSLIQRKVTAQSWSRHPTQVSLGFSQSGPIYHYTHMYMDAYNCRAQEA